MLDRILKMFDASQGDRMKGAESIAGQDPIIPTELSEQDWGVLYARYREAHEEAGIPVSDSEKFEKSVIANMEFVNRVSPMLRK